MLPIVGPNMWNSIFIELKQECFLKAFKKSTNLWKPAHCPSRLCKTYINDVGFLQASHFIWFCYMHVIDILELVC